jgi:hypothetical protein
VSAPRQSASDRRVNRAWVECLLRRGLAAECAAGRLPATGADPVASLGQYLQRLRPVVLLEAAIPYAEQLVADILVERGFASKATTIVKLLDGEIDLALPDGDESLVLLSFYEPAGIANPLDLRNRLENTGHAVLIGCQRAEDLPATYRRLVDLTVTLPAAGAADVDEVFRGLLGAPLPAATDGQWRQFVLPTDLQQPVRLGYAPAAAAAYVERRVRERQARVTAAQAPDLASLHGLGEARDIAQDVVHDIGLALAGTVPWREVDRGMLVVGPPGTGKTTLARAIAKGCGVHFIAASPAAWQGGDLGVHLANIRATFDEARRAGAAIVFIDEVDGIGNRGRLEQGGRTYQTKVINALLEELDGFSAREGVVVIGATNDESLVDPALRRAGRFDQVVRVPYPNIAALEAIWAHHLAPHRRAGRIDPALDVAELAALSFGLTGADVEFFVRGGARRARRRGGAIGRAELVAEIMRRPRDAGPGRRIDAATLARLAVHEAGHALVQLAGPAGGADIGYVSVAPRSDGRVGFVARLPDERVSLTRADMLHEIMVCLGGRAAEELAYGPDGVSDLAGDRGPASDLAVATARAAALRGTSGLAPESGLLWWAGLPEGLRGGLDAAVEATLQESYAAALALLGARRAALDRVVAALVRDQEISGAALRRLA